MDNNIPLMLKVPFSNAGYYFVAFSNVTIVAGSDNCIQYLLDGEQEKIFTLMSVDGHEIDIYALKCKSYEEFLVALDLNSLLHGGSLINSDDIKTELKSISGFKAEAERLREENIKLKKKFNSMKKMLKSFDVES